MSRPGMFGACFRIANGERYVPAAHGSFCKGFWMTREEMIAAIEGEIARLEQVRELLHRSTSSRFTAAGVDGSAAARKPRVLSAEARKRIAQAQKRRWAKHRKETAAHEKR